MSVQQRIDQAVAAIVNACVDRLSDEMEENGLLSEVNTLVKHDVSSANLTPPSMWVWPETANASTDMGLHETWNLPVVVACLVQNVNDPVEGKDKATELAGIAHQLLLDGNPRFDELKYVDDITSLRFEPSGPRQTNDRRTMFWADGVVNVRFRRRQPNV